MILCGILNPTRKANITFCLPATRSYSLKLLPRARFVTLGNRLNFIIVYKRTPLQKFLSLTLTLRNKPHYVFLLFTCSSVKQGFILVLLTYFWRFSAMLPRIIAGKHYLKWSQVTPNKSATLKRANMCHGHSF